MLELITLGDPRLRARSVPADPEEVRDLVREMFTTMYAEEGIGLAAVQVGRPLRVCITKVQDDRERVYINPEIIETSIEEDTAEEGCLSIPGKRADITRPARVSVQATSLKGRIFRLDAQGLLARAIQHELDHLNGRLFIDHMDERERDALLADYQD
jgi:peptide deformylase